MIGKEKISVWLIWQMCLLICIEASAQFQFNNATRISKDEGLPSNHIRVIKQCGNGFIWIGTEEGLCRFDGSQVKVYQNNSRQSNSLLYNRINDILAEKDRIWVTTGVGISVLDICADTFSNYIFDPLGNRFASAPKGHLQISAIYKDRLGEIWCGTRENGFSRYNVQTDNFEFFKYTGNGPEQLPNPNGVNDIISICENPKNDSIVWFGTVAGLLEFNRYSGSLEWYYFPQKNKDFETKLNVFRGIYAHDDGLLYAGSWGSGVKVFDPQNKTLTQLPVNGTPSAFVSVGKFTRKSETEIWITSGAGLECYNTQTREITFLIKNVNNENKYYGAHYIDKEGRFWVITHNGVYFYDPVLQQFAIRSYAHLNDDLWGFARDVVYHSSDKTITVCPQNTIALFHYHPQSRNWTRTLVPQKYLSPDESGMTGRQIVKSPFDDFTINHINGLFSYDPTREKVGDFPFKPELEYKSIRSILWDSKGQLWIGTWRDGLIRWNPKTNQAYNFKAELEADQIDHSATTIEYLFEDSNNNIWINRNQGISVFIADRDTIVNHLSAINKDNTFYNSKGFAEDRYGKVWIAGMHGYVGYAESFNPEKGIVRKINLSKSDSTLVWIDGVATDPNGDIWLLGNDNLIKMDVALLETTLHSYKYGMPDNEFYAFEFLPSGELVIGLRGAIVLINPDKLEENKELPKPYVSNIQVHDENYKSDTTAIMRKSLNLEYWENSFSFDFSALSFTLPEYNKFRYRLSNFNNDWIDAKERRFANYTNVPAGNYIFQLQAANNEGVWNARTYELSVIITTSWWNTWWFRIAVLLLVLYFGYSMYRYRILQVRNEAKLKSEFEKQLANVEMNALRAQMNPHFLFNCLNSIDSYIIKNETKKASEYLNKFARLIRLILQNSRSNYVNLKDEIEALDLYLNMESLRFKDKFDYEIKVGEELDVESIDVPPMLIQPYIENAIWHGLMHKTDGEKGKVELKLNRQNGSLKCIVEDNGIGREKALEFRSKKYAGRKKSMGMRITQDRIQIINKMFDSKTSVEIFDLKDNQGRPAGTRVELYIPI